MTDCGDARVTRDEWTKAGLSAWFGHWLHSVSSDARLLDCRQAGSNPYGCQADQYWQVRLVFIDDSGMGSPGIGLKSFHEKAGPRQE